MTLQTPIVAPSELPDAAAIFRMSMMRTSHPELGHAEAKARVRLAAAIIAMDEAEAQPERHSLTEQAEVEAAKNEYAQALANLLRGDECS